MFIYLHGFNSAPASFKARLLATRLAQLGRPDAFAAPALPHRPGEAIAAAQAEIARHDPATVTLIGSSLGGHYATWLAETHGLRAVLVNPAVRPHVLLAGALGPQTNLYTGERYELTQGHLDELEALEVATITQPHRYLLLVATGDEVLDYHDAVAKYRGAVQVVHAGGDHGFGEFSAHLDAVIDFGALLHRVGAGNPG
jgi:predicted esterase YcpF (UPF0227 family)